MLWFFSNMGETISCCQQYSPSPQSSDKSKYGNYKPASSFQQKIIDIVNPKFANYSGPFLLAVTVAASTLIIFAAALGYFMLNIKEVDPGVTLFNPNDPNSLPKKDNMKCIRSLKSVTVFVIITPQ